MLRNYIFQANMCFKIEIYDTNTEDSCKSIGGIRKIQKISFT